MNVLLVVSWDDTFGGVVSVASLLVAFTTVSTWPNLAAPDTVPTRRAASRTSCAWPSRGDTKVLIC